MIEQQVFNYLLWLKERGQGYFVPGTVPTNVKGVSENLADPIIQEASEAADAAPAAEHTPPSVPAPTAVPQFKVLFLSLLPLTAPEDEMVSRIGMALNLQASDFKIVSGEEAKTYLTAQEHCYGVLMGEDAKTLVVAKEGQNLLHISHPGAMLKEPQLKVTAWNTLQKLKAAL